MSDDLVLVLNCGSSSIKFAVINVNQERTEFSGLVQNIGTASANLEWKYLSQKQHQDVPTIHYEEALQKIVALIRGIDELNAQIIAVGHRVVHGGEYFTESMLVDAHVLATIQECIHLAPLHNPANLLGIQEAQKAYPKLPQIAVFDTAFHQSMPDYAFTYAIPQEWYKEYGVRRYGFHGTSHRFVTREAAKHLEKPYETCALISAHLGNGCSIAAVLNGKSVDTSMGLTPLEGLVMGTRCGDIDPSMIVYMSKKLNCNAQTVTDFLNKNSGLLGISGIDSDMRNVMQASESGNQEAKLAIEVFCYRLAKYILAYLVPLQSLDALIFTGGIGENASAIRSNVLAWLKVLNFHVDTKRNAIHGAQSNGLITLDKSTPAYVIQTNEELLIAQDAALIADIS